MVKALTNGLMEGNILEIGKSIRCMAQVSSHGPMVDAMKESTTTIRSKEEVCSLGLMAGSTTDSGRMESKKV